MSYTLDETGKALTETRDGVTMPADNSFASVNDFVHNLETDFEDLQSLCLGMATENDQLRADLKEMTDKNWRVARDLAKSRVELEKERERVKLLTENLTNLRDILESIHGDNEVLNAFKVHYTLDDLTAANHALSAGEGGGDD